MNYDELNDVKQLIDLMQASLVELFDQLRELRERLHLLPGLSLDASPSVMSLFSEVKKTTSTSDDAVTKDTDEILGSKQNNDEEIKSPPQNQSTPLSEDEAIFSAEPPDNISAASEINAKVGRVLDPIARELRTGEATADIILEYLQAAKEYLIDKDERKKKVARDMDIVLNFLNARGKRGIRAEERDNILKRIQRWKAHLASYSDSPADTK